MRNGIIQCLNWRLIHSKGDPTVQAPNLFFEKIETNKLRLLQSRWGMFLLGIYEILTGEKICRKCNRCEWLRELPGEFRDFDADDEFGADGIPLCTGKYQKTPEFKKLQKIAEDTRNKNYELTGKFMESLDSPEYRSGVREVNAQLKKIAVEALGLIKRPAKYCLGQHLKEQG